MGQVRTAASDTANHTLESLDAKARTDAYNATVLQQTSGNTATDVRVQQLERRLDHRNSFEAIPNRQRVGSGSQHSHDASLMPPPGKVFTHVRNRE